MAHEKQGAGVAREHLLEEVERFEVEVVGGLVQHEKVGRTHQGHARSSAGDARRLTAPSPGCNLLGSNGDAFM